MPRSARTLAMMRAFSRYAAPAPTMWMGLMGTAWLILVCCGRWGEMDQVVWRATQEQLIALHRHYTEIIERCYPQSGITLDFSIEDVLTLTNDIAAAAAASR